MCWCGRTGSLNNFGFWIADFGLGKIHEDIIPNSMLQSSIRQSKIKNPKWVGIFAIALTFVFGEAVAQAQQPMREVVTTDMALKKAVERFRNSPSGMRNYGSSLLD
jgi:hypothetical protein